mgnify:CR=1 FL=1
MKQISGLFRYPLKSHGRETLSSMLLRAGMTLPWDRVWAVAHDASTADGSEWAACRNFSIGSKAPSLMAIEASLDEETETLTLTHPDRPDLTFNPNNETAKLIDWVLPLVPTNRALPNRILRLPNDRGFTDSDFPSVTLCNLASHRAVEEQLGTQISPKRWRGNIWFDGDQAWEEWDWVGKELRIGNAVLRVRERTERCMATTANPDTGLRDADTLGALMHWGHRDFSVRAEVITSGQVAIGDALEII